MALERKLAVARRNNDNSPFNIDAALADRLSTTQEDDFVHFQYEGEMFIVIYGPDPTEGFTGTGTTLGKAIQDLINNMTREDLEESGALS